MGGKTGEKQETAPRVDLRRARIPSALIALLPADLARRYRVFPLGRRGGTLTVALADPADLEVLDGLGFALGVRVRGRAAPPAEIGEAIAACYGRQ